MRVFTTCTWSAVVSVLALTCTVTSASAAEKYWLAQKAELIVIGTYHHTVTFPWIDGWHVLGSVDVLDTLYGPRVPRKLEYQFVCGWRMCRRWPAPNVEESMERTGIFFLVSADKNRWEPPDHVGIDPGVRRTTQRKDFENYIQAYKR